MYIYLRVCVLVFLQYNIYIIFIHVFPCVVFDSICMQYAYIVMCACQIVYIDAFMCARLGACFATSKTLPWWVGFIGKIQPIRILPSDPAWACPIKLIKACQCVQAVSIVGGVQVSSNNVRFDCHSSHAKRTIQQLGKTSFLTTNDAQISPCCAFAGTTACACDIWLDGNSIDQKRWTNWTLL